MGTAPAHMTQVGQIVNGRQRQQALRQLTRKSLQIHFQVCFSTEVNAGKRCAWSPGYSCKYASRAGCRQEAASSHTLICVHVHSQGQLSTGCNASRLCASSLNSWGRLSTGGNTGRRCASLSEHVCIYLSRTAC